MFNMDNIFDMPRDVIEGESLCQIIGQKEIVVENYKCVKTICHNQIEVISKKYKINIIGDNLNIKYYDSQSMVIGGYICEVKFLQN